MKSGAGIISTQDVHSRSKAPGGEPTRRGRPRDPGLDLAILDSAFALMVETGIRGFSVREVARRSGIPKSSIYRRWPTRGDLLAAVLARLSTNGSTPDTGTLRGDLVEVVRKEIASLESSDGVLPRVALEARSDPELAPVVQEILKARRRTHAGVLSRGAARGEVRGSVDQDAALDLVLGPVWSRLISHRPLRSADAEGIVDDAIKGIGEGAAG